MAAMLCSTPIGSLAVASGAPATSLKPQFSTQKTVTSFTLRGRIPNRRFSIRAEATGDDSTSQQPEGQPKMSIRDVMVGGMAGVAVAIDAVKGAIDAVADETGEGSVKNRMKNVPGSVESSREERGKKYVTSDMGHDAEILARDAGDASHIDYDEDCETQSSSAADDASSKFGEFGDKLSGNVDRTRGQAGSAAKGLGEKATDSVKDVAENVQGSVEGGVEKAKYVTSDMGEEAEALARDAGDGGHRAGEEFQTQTRRAADDVSNKSGEFGDNLSGNVDRTRGQAESAARDVSDNAKGAFDSAKDAVNQMGDDAKQAARDVTSNV